MSGSGWIWFAFAVVQFVVAGYALAAVASWRGARLFPAPGHPLGRVPLALAAAAVVALVALLLGVRDSEFSRYLGTGVLMVAGVVVLAALARADRRG